MQTSVAANAESPFRVHHCPAVQCCIDAYDRVCPAPVSGRPSYDQRDLGKQAFRATMPDLTSRDSIRDFIACVGYGLLAQVFLECEATRLLYAAQVALHALPRDPAPSRPRP